MNKKLIELQEKINYQFKDLELLTLALTHRSVGGVNNERLEFLGDSILNFAIGSALYKQFPQVQEGDLSRMRSTLVKEPTLAHIANIFGLSEYIILGVGEQKNNGKYRASTLADAVEAIIGAVYLDSTEDTAHQMVVNWFKDLLKDIVPGDEQKDAKTRLQEYLQSKKFNLPVYEIVDIKGKAHNQFFYATCTVEELSIVRKGSGTTRRLAEQDAAYNTLKDILK